MERKPKEADFFVIVIIEIV